VSCYFFPTASIVVLARHTKTVCQSVSSNQAPALDGVFVDRMLIRHSLYVVWLQSIGCPSTVGGLDFGVETF